jgi:hypothetical protein
LAAASVVVWAVDSVAVLVASVVVAAVADSEDSGADGAEAAAPAEAGERARASGQAFRERLNRSLSQ